MNKTKQHSPAQPRLRRIAAALLALGQVSLPVYALDANTLPRGGQVVAGSGTITENGSAMNINQQSQRVAINWQQFNIGANASVNFAQPNAQAVALNRVLGGDGSQIFGRLTANGQVFVVNPAGVLFAPGARVDVGGLVATTLPIGDDDFMAGRYRFGGGTGRGSVLNQGEIRAADGGLVALLAPEVRNEGLIQARLGKVALAAGNRVTLDVGNGLFNVAVDEAAVNAQAANRHLVVADGGEVVMSARAAGDLTRSVINQEGIIRATSLSEKNGVIRLEGGPRGNVLVSGTLDASGRDAGEKGGTIKVLGEQVAMLNGATADASGHAGGGTVLVGGNYQGKGSEQTARNTVIAPDAKILANALHSGDGGKVIVWADDTTRFLGAIEARGGAQSGNGGFVETSGKEKLQALGSVSAQAVKGKAGTWLLDPIDVLILAEATYNPAGFDGGNPTSIFTPTSLLQGVTDGTINAVLDSGTNVRITTGSTGAQNGNVTFQAGARIWKSTLGAATFEVVAAGDIIAGVANGQSGRLDIGTSGGASLNVSLTAGRKITIGDPVILNQTTISTNGGNVTMRANGGNLDTRYTTINAGSGAVDLQSSGAISLGDTASIQGGGYE